MTKKKIICLWSINSACAGEVKLRRLIFGDGVPSFNMYICEKCFNAHNEIIKISKEHNCGGEEAVEIFYNRKETN